MPSWVWFVLVGVGIVVAAIATALKVIEVRAGKRHEQERQQEFERKLRARDLAWEERRLAKEACGLWCSWQNTRLGTRVYRLEEHNVPREQKEQRVAREQPGYYGGTGGTVAVAGSFWLAQTHEHEGEGHFVMNGCAACEQEMEAHIEEETHDRYGSIKPFSDLGYESADGTIHSVTYQGRY